MTLKPVVCEIRIFTEQMAGFLKTKVGPANGVNVSTFHKNVRLPKVNESLESALDREIPQHFIFELERQARRSGDVRYCEGIFMQDWRAERPRDQRLVQIGFH